MATLKYEKDVVRKPAIVTEDYRDEVPETDDIPVRCAEDTGPMVMFSPDFVKEANSIVEYGIISGDIAIGADKYVTEPHKHDYEEIFLFLGTDPKNTRDLGAEVEFWLGEGDDTEKIILTTSSSVYVPPGVAHFPQYWRNVKRPVMTVVIMPSASKKVMKRVSAEGRG